MSIANMMEYTDMHGNLLCLVVSSNGVHTTGFCLLEDYSSAAGNSKNKEAIHSMAYSHIGLSPLLGDWWFPGVS